MYRMMSSMNRNRKLASGKRDGSGGGRGQRESYNQMLRMLDSMNSILGKGKRSKRSEERGLMDTMKTMQLNELKKKLLSKRGRSSRGGRRKLKDMKGD